MNIFTQQLEVHEDLLRLRGYDEAGLNSPDKPGWFLKQLERQFSLACRDAHTQNEKQEFSLKAVGFFNKDSDVILFTFNYEYDPAKELLSIRSLQAKMNEKELEVQLRANKELPPSKAVYNSLGKKDQSLEFARTIAEHTISQNGKHLLKQSR